MVCQGLASLSTFHIEWTLAIFPVEYKTESLSWVLVVPLHVCWDVPLDLDCQLHVADHCGPTEHTVEWAQHVDSVHHAQELVSLVSVDYMPGADASVQEELVLTTPMVQQILESLTTDWLSTEFESLREHFSVHQRILQLIVSQELMTENSIGSCKS